MPMEIRESLAVRESLPVTLPRIKILLGILVFSILIAVGADLAFVKGNADMPLKVYVLFALLGISAVGYTLRISWLRYIILLISAAYLGFYEAGCMCSNGSLETLFMNLGMNVSNTAKIGMHLFRVSILAAVVFFTGNVFCGWVCPKGAVQEFLHREKTRITVPPKWDRVLKKIRYLFLALIVLYPLFYHQRIFNRIDPFKVVFNFSGTVWILMFMGVVLIASIFIYRPFCRYVCPLGAFLGLINKIGILNLKLAPADRCTCTNGGCEKACPAQAISKPRQKNQPPQVDKAYCFSCIECENRCQRNKVNKV